MRIGRMATPHKIVGIPKWLATQDEKSVANKHYQRSIRYYKALYKAAVSWADMDKVAAIYKESKKRRKEGEQVQVDHMVPVIHPHVCGLHNEFNLQIIPEVENLRKGNHWWPDMWHTNLELDLQPKQPKQLKLI